MKGRPERLALLDALPLDPRDPDIVRAKQLQRERKRHEHAAGRRCTVTWLLHFFGALSGTGAAILILVGLRIAMRTAIDRVDQWAIRRRARKLALFTVQDTRWLAEQRIDPFRTPATKRRAARGTADA